MSAPPSRSPQDVEMQRFVMQQQQHHEFFKAMAKLTDQCWTVCIKTPTGKFSNDEKTCMKNCTNRFLQASALLMDRVVEPEA